MKMKMKEVSDESLREEELKLRKEPKEFQRCLKFTKKVNGIQMLHLKISSLNLNTKMIKYGLAAVSDVQCETL